MANVEASVRDLVNRDRDCTERAQAQMDLRRQINLLVGEWKAAGGGEVLPDIQYRVRLRLLKNETVPAGVAALRKFTNGADGGRRWRKTRTPTGF